MTERFVVPEPSEEAVRGAHGVWFGERAIYAATEANLGYWREAAQKLYAVDVPRIVRAEVERALDAIFGKDGLKDCSAQRYLAARFPDVTPHTADVTQDTTWRGCWAHGGEVRIGCEVCKKAEAERIARFGEAAPEKGCNCWADTPERTECPHHPWRDPTPSEPAEKGATHAFMLFDGSREPGCLYTPAERAFLRALAEHFEHWGERLGRLSRAEISERGYTMRDAARRVTEEAKTERWP